MITVADPHRRDMVRYYGEVTLRLADVVVISKIDSADSGQVQMVRKA